MKDKHRSRKTNQKREKGEKSKRDRKHAMKKVCWRERKRGGIRGIKRKRKNKNEWKEED
jgi:hypothetical protein